MIIFRTITIYLENKKNISFHYELYVHITYTIKPEIEPKPP